MHAQAPTASGVVATRILGLDPGLRITGFGLIDKLGSQLRYVASGTIKTPDGALPGVSRRCSTACAKWWPPTALIRPPWRSCS